MLGRTCSDRLRSDRNRSWASRDGICGDGGEGPAADVETERLNGSAGRRLVADKQVFAARIAGDHRRVGSRGKRRSRQQGKGSIGTHRVGRKIRGGLIRYIHVGASLVDEETNRTDIGFTNRETRFGK